MPIVPREYTRNMDVNMARRLDDVLTYFNFHSMAENNEYNTEIQEKVLYCRDIFRSYWMTVEAMWEGFETNDIDEMYSDIAKAFAVMAEIWGELRW